MRFRSRLYQFMQGRNGVDALAVFSNRFSFGCLLAALLFTFLSVLCLRHNALTAATVFRVLYFVAYGIGLLMLGFWAFRVFSKNVSKRQAENTRYLYRMQKLKQKWTDFRHLFNPKYKYFRCPQCRQRMRAPRRRGKIRVTCSGCGHIFITKT